jgi:hypothetical protein
VAIAVVLWIPGFLSYSPIIGENDVTIPMYQFVVRYLPHTNWFLPLLSLLIVIAAAIILNNIFILHNLIPKNSLLPAFLFILFMSSSPQTLTLYPVILVLLPMVFFLHLSYQVYEQFENPNKALSLGLLAGISSMIYFPAALMILFIWLVFLIYRSFSWRQWAVALLGYTLPYLYMIVYYFWMDSVPGLIENYRNNFSHILNISAHPDNFQLATWIIFTLLLLLPALVRIISTIGSQNITFRRKMSVTIWMAVFAVMAMVFGGEIKTHNLLFIPAAGIVAYQFHSIKKSAWNDIVILAYLVLIGVHNYLDR